MATHSKKRTPPDKPPVAAPLVPPGGNTLQVVESQGAPIDAEADWVFVRAEAEAQSPDTLERPTVTVKDAAMLGMTVARRAHSPAERAEFEKLIRVKLLDEAHYAKLSRYAGALFYVRAQLDRAPTASLALVPADVTDKGDVLRRRMVKVLSFYFGEETDVGKTLVKIRPGNGYTDLVGDLVTLATLYNTHRARIENTPEFYFATDEADAKKVAGDIVGHLSSTVDAPTWTDSQQRVWTLFRRAYDEVAAGGRYLFRHDADVGERFPTLHSLNAVGRQSPATKPDPSKPDPVNPDPSKPDPVNPDPA